MGFLNLTGACLLHLARTWFLRKLRGEAASILHYLLDQLGYLHIELIAAPSEEWPQVRSSVRDKHDSSISSKYAHVMLSALAPMTPTSHQ